MQEAQRSVTQGVLSLLSCPSEVGLVKGLALLALMASASSAWLLMACEGALGSLVSPHSILWAQLGIIKDH